MFFLFVFAIALREAFAASEQAPENRLTQPSAIDIVADFNFSSIQSYSSLNSTDLNAKLFVECDGDRYGVKFDTKDCKDAKDNVPYKSKQWAFAQRHTPSFVKNEMFPLPYRSMGGNCVPSTALPEEQAICRMASLMVSEDKGSCYVDTTLDEGHEVGHASLGQIQEAAVAVINKCVKNRNPQGGVAHNIGGDNSLAVAVGAYNHPVECRGQFQPWRSCREILADMPTTQREEIFGPLDDPHADVKLPQGVISDDERCLMRIFSIGGSDKTSWYQLWEVATAIFAVCAQQGKGGSAKGVGDDGKLLVNMVHNMQPRDENLS